MKIKFLILKTIVNHHSTMQNQKLKFTKTLVQCKKKKKKKSDQMKQLEYSQDFFNLYILWKSLVHYRKLVMRMVQQQKIMDELKIRTKDKTYYPSWTLVKVGHLVKSIKALASNCL